MNIKPIVGTAIGLGATSLVLQSTKLIPRQRIQKKRTRRMIRTGTGLLIGGAFLGAMAGTASK